MTPQKKHLIWITKVLLTAAIVAAVWYGWAVLLIIILFSCDTLTQWYVAIPLVTAAGVALLALVAHWLWNLPRLRRAVLWLAGVVAVGATAFFGWRWWSHDRFPVLHMEINWDFYGPFRSGNLLVKATAPEELRFTGKQDWGAIGGAYGFYPVYAAAVEALCPSESYYWNNAGSLKTEGSDTLYDRLLDGTHEIIFALAPSAKQRAAAAAKGDEYELTRIGREAFVFFVNTDNPVEGLTQAQIRDIYSGKATDWLEIAPEKLRGKILAFQRNEGSGSQTALQKIMGETAIMPPIREDRVGGMGDIINDVADYRAFPGALGFSFRVYATRLLRNDRIKLLAVDGIAPTAENIRNGTYPFCRDMFMVTVKGRKVSPNVDKLRRFMLSPAGREIVGKTGYVAAE